LAAIADDDEVGFGLYEINLHVVLLRGGADPLDRVRDDQNDGNRFARRGTFAFDA